MKSPLKNIFISSIHQNAGKTTTTLGLMQALKDRKYKITFIKPVGQQVVHVANVDVDKDTYLINQVFRLGKKYSEMSPVTIGSGYTEKYIFHPEKEKHTNKILRAFESLTKNKQVIVVEGTGHAGVGSVIDHSNAEVARLLGSKAIIISGGGIGKSIDEIMLNKALFDQQGVEIIGVIINKVRQNKYEKVKKALKQGLKNKGVRLLGVIPMQPMLSSPTIEQILERLNLKLLCGKEGVARRVMHNIVAAMEPHNMIHYLKPNSLVITSGDRVDNILVAVSSHLVNEGPGKGGNRIAGIILTGGLMPNPKIIELLRKSQIPIMITDDDTYTVAAHMEHFVCKIRKDDKDKIQEAARLIKKYVDIDAILSSF